MSGFRGGFAFDLVDLGWFEAARVGCDRYSGRFDIHSMLISFAAVSLATVSTLSRHDFDILVYNLGFQ